MERRAMKKPPAAAAVARPETRHADQPLDLSLLSRTKCFGDWDEIGSKISVLNIGAYHSKSFNDTPLLAVLPSSRMSIAWAQEVLFPQAIAGRRVVICLPAARFWGLELGKQYGKSLFAPDVTRAGAHEKMRTQLSKTAPFTGAMGYPCPYASHVFEML